MHVLQENLMERRIVQSRCFCFIYVIIWTTTYAPLFSLATSLAYVCFRDENTFDLMHLRWNGTVVKFH